MSEYMRRVRAGVGNLMLEIPSVAVLSFDAEGRVLLARHAELGVWTTPGGAVEPEETPADAAVREMWEETGLQVELARVIGIYGGPEFVVTYANGDRVSFLTTVFEGRVRGGRPEPDGVEILELGWFSAREAAAAAMHGWTRIVLADAFARDERTRFAPPRWQPA